MRIMVDGSYSRDSVDGLVIEDNNNNKKYGGRMPGYYGYT